ncbi:MAG: 3-isopropylmalate dehydratase/homoaconitate hydratase family large subunit [Clostridiaceae bacterium]|nr:3-isopropylmalate dehydratase/homoaconitate hydratase family large subunit [Clostridiaceae bacterium]
MNLIEKYLAESAELEEVKAGQDIRCNVALVAAHDVTGPIAIERFREIGVSSVFDRERVILVIDHIYPASTVKARENAWIMQEFANEFGITLHKGGEGVIHQVLYEKHRVEAGKIVVIADSHTCTCGGYGAIGIGVGSTELAVAMATGKLDLEVPEVVQVYLTGKLHSNVFGKDLILYLGQIFGSDYLTDKGLLINGPGIDYFSTEERMTVCNMGTELGSMITLFGSKERDNDVSESKEINLSLLNPKIASPYSPVNVSDVKDVEGRPITQVVVGSCTNGRLNDMEQVVKRVKGKKVHADLNFLIIPASKQVLSDMEKLGWCKILRDAGATILNPGCGPCFGAHQGLVSEKDVVVSTTNRNFPGRMGSVDARIYLASPATAAESALSGKISVPSKIK